MPNHFFGVGGSKDEHVEIGIESIDDSQVKVVTKCNQKWDKVVMRRAIKVTNM